MRYSKGRQERESTRYTTINHFMSTRNPWYKPLMLAAAKREEKDYKPTVAQVVMADCPRLQRKRRKQDARRRRTIH